MANKKNPSLRPPSNVQLVSNLQRSAKVVRKPYTVERGRDDYLFLDQCPEYIVSAA